MLVLGSIAADPRGHSCPTSTTVAEALLLVDLAVLIYFIHHIAKSIQLPEVIAGIARDLTRAIDAEFPQPEDRRARPGIGRRREVRARVALQLIDERGAAFPRTRAAICSSSGMPSSSTSQPGPMRSFASTTVPATFWWLDTRSPRSGHEVRPSTWG